MGCDYEHDRDGEFYAERLQVAQLDAQNRANGLLAPMTRLEWYGSIGVAALMLALVAWVL